MCRVPRPAPKRVLGERRGVGVVLDPGRQVEALPDPVAQAQALDRDVHGRDSLPRPLVDEGRNADADPDDALVDERPDRALDLRDERLLARRLGVGDRPSATTPSRPTSPVRSFVPPMSIAMTRASVTSAPPGTVGGPWLP